MINYNTNPHGVFTCISPKGVHLSYAVDSKEQVEIFFTSVNTALKSLEVKDINEVTGLKLISRYYNSLAS